MATSVNWQTKVSEELDNMVTELATKMGIGKQELVRFVVSSYCQNQLATQQHLKESINNLILETGEKALEDFKQLSFE